MRTPPRPIVVGRRERAGRARHTAQKRWRSGPTRASPTHSHHLVAVHAHVAPALERSRTARSSGMSTGGTGAALRIGQGARTRYTRLTGQSIARLRGGNDARGRRSAQLDRRQGPQPREPPSASSVPRPRDGADAGRPAGAASTCAAPHEDYVRGRRAARRPAVGWAREPGARAAASTSWPARSSSAARATTSSRTPRCTSAPTAS